MEFQFEVDDAVDRARFEQDLETERLRNGFPPVVLRWNGNRFVVSVASNRVPEAELRKLMKLSLSRQGRRLNEV